MRSTPPTRGAAACGAVPKIVLCAALAVSVSCLRVGLDPRHEACADGETRDCYTGPPGTRDTGACRGGTQTCAGGRWSACNGEVVPADETCDGADTDCDGVDDDDLVEPCYSGPPGTEGVGVCRPGTRRCVDDAWTECEGEVTPDDQCGVDPCGDDGCGGLCEACPEGRRCIDTRPATCAPDAEARVLVPAGTFTMGSNAFAAARPAHPVTITEPFFIDRFEVTAGRYRECVEDDVCIALAGGAECSYSNARWDRPMNCISWAQASFFCQEFAGGDLPTEAQWEYAARGTDERPYPWGDAPPSCERAVYFDCLVEPILVQAVGSVPAGASPYGAEDMSGNAWEWMRDFWDANAYDLCQGGCEDPTGPETGTERVSRGGGQFASDVRVPMVYPLSALRADNRDGAAAEASFVDIGFRCVYPGE